MTQKLSRATPRKSRKELNHPCIFTLQSDTDQPRLSVHAPQFPTQHFDAEGKQHECVTGEEASNKSGKKETTTHSGEGSIHFWPSREIQSVLRATSLRHVDMYVDCLVCVVWSIVRLENGKRALIWVKAAYPNLSCFGKNLILSCACILEPG